MICDKCHKNEACVHIRGMDQSGKSQMINICATCAMAVVMQADPAALEPILQEFRRASLASGEDILKLMMADQQQRGGADESLDKSCPACNTRLRAVLGSAQISCAGCLDAFADEIGQWLRERGGRAATDDSAADDSAVAADDGAHFTVEAGRLAVMLESAVKAERYELAHILAQKLQKQREHQARQQSLAADESWGRLPDAGVLTRVCLPLPRPFWLPAEVDEKPLVRLTSYAYVARNLQDFPLPPFAGQPGAAANLTDLLEEFLRLDPLFQGATLHRGESLDKEQRVEILSHLWFGGEYLRRAHPVRIHASSNGRAVALQNHTDHLQLRLTGPAADAATLASLAADFTGRLESCHAVCRDTRFGVVVRDLERLGTGGALGMVLHLPALCLSGQIDKVMRATLQMGLRLAPFAYGGEKKFAHLFSLETLPGQWEWAAAAAELAEISAVLAGHESDARTFMQSGRKRRLVLCDAVGRAAAMVRGVRLLGFGEAANLLSLLWLGIELEMLPKLEYRHLYRKFAELQVAPGVLFESRNRDRDLLRLQSLWGTRFRRDLGGMEDVE